MLYHATYKARIPSIKKLGLGAKQMKNWEDSEDGILYFAIDPYVAESYAEAAEDVAPSVYNSGIVILVVKTAFFDARYLVRDNNIIDNDGCTLGYRGIIHPKLIGIWNEKGIKPLLKTRIIRAR